MRRRQVAPSATANANWSEEEDQKLVDVISEMQRLPSWKAVAEHVKGRSHLQCRDRYHKVIKKSPLWNAALKEVTLPRPGGWRGAVKVNESAAEPDNVLLIEVPSPCEETTDAFTFESMHAIGALPHLAQPVPHVMPSPDSMKQLPMWTEPLQRAQHAATFEPRIVPRIVPRIMPKCNGAPQGARIIVSIVPTMEADLLPHLHASRALVTTGRALDRVNFSINRAPVKTPTTKPAKRVATTPPRARSVAAAADGIVFNARLVRAE